MKNAEYGTLLINDSAVCEGGAQPAAAPGAQGAAFRPWVNSITECQLRSVGRAAVMEELDRP